MFLRRCIIVVFWVAATNNEMEIAAFKTDDMNFLLNDSDINCHGRFLNVSVHLTSAMLQRVVESEQTVYMFANMHLSWSVPELSWSPTDHNNLTKVHHVKPEKVCFPEIAIHGSGASEVLTRDDYKHDVTVDHTGEVTIMKPSVFICNCRMEMNYFPVDSHTCLVVISSPTYDLTEMELTPRSAVVESSHPVNSTLYLSLQPDFVVLWVRSLLAEGVVSKILSKKPLVVYGIRVRRNTWHYFILYIIPSTIVTAVSIVGFFTPSHSANNSKNQKVQIGLVGLLALLSQAVALASSVPVTDTAPIVVWYYLFLVVVMVLGILVATAILSVKHHGVMTNTPPPRWVVNLTLCCSTRRNTSKASDENKDGDKTVRDAAVLWYEVVTTVDKVCRIIFLSTLISVLVCSYHIASEESV